MAACLNPVHKIGPNVGIVDEPESFMVQFPLIVPGLLSPFFAMVLYTIPKRRPILRMFSTMLRATSQKRFSFLSLATRQECAERCLAESILMYPQRSTRRVPDVRHVSVCHRFMSLQTTSHLLLQFFITAVPVFQYVFCCRGS